MKILFHNNSKIKNTWGIIHALKEAFGYNFQQSYNLIGRMINEKSDSCVVKSGTTLNDFDRVHRIFSEYGLNDMISHVQ